MRWFVAVVVAVLIAWGWFLVSPYWALLDIAQAIERRDAPHLVERVNLLALRNSLARQIASESVLPPSQAIGPADRSLAAAALSAAASPLLDRYLTADGIAALLREPLAESGIVAPAAARDSPGPGVGNPLKQAAILFEASRWRGFRNVYFAVPPDRAVEGRVRLQMRLSRFRWRLVSLDLSAKERDRVADEILGR